MKVPLKKKKHGFTLIEIIIVLVILAILAAFTVPSYIGFLNKANGVNSVAVSRQVYLASPVGLLEWKAAGSPGNSDTTFKCNIESNIINHLELGELQSYTSTKNPENVVEVSLSLPSYYVQGWDSFVNECKTKNYRNFARVWIGKNLDYTIGDTIKGIYYVSADGKYVSRIVYDKTTKLGSTGQKTGTYYERIK